MSPILVRPVREQLEHDRIIRLLQSKFRRKFEAGMNPGAQLNAAVGTGPAAIYPDLVLFSQERGRRLQAVVEVETGESVNHLEALAQWAHFAKLRAPFHLYVPSARIDVARRLCEDNSVTVSEMWAYHAVGDDVRFTLVERSRSAVAVAAPKLPKLPKTTTAAPRSKPTAKAGRKLPAKSKSAPATKSSAKSTSKVKAPAKPSKASRGTKNATTARKAARPAAKRR